MLCFGWGPTSCQRLCACSVPYTCSLACGTFQILFCLFCSVRGGEKRSCLSKSGDGAGFMKVEGGGYLRWRWWGPRIGTNISFRSPQFPPSYGGKARCWKVCSFFSRNQCSTCAAASASAIAATLAIAFPSSDAAATCAGSMHPPQWPQNIEGKSVSFPPLSASLCASAVCCVSRPSFINLLALKGIVRGGGV